MKQVFIKKGQVLTREVPSPTVQQGMILVDTQVSCISPGTELSGLAASSKTLLRKALEKPDKVRAALDRMKVQGVRTVLQKAQSQVEAERPIGYSAAGVVLEVGEGVRSFQVGDRAAVAGAAFARHAAQVAVPENLAVRIPDGVDFSEASSVALGAIALQGVRRAGLQLGETASVIGCGVMGLLSVQMLKASGCRVIAVDLDPERARLAKDLGADEAVASSEEDPVKCVAYVTEGYGADAVLITAATSSSEPVAQAFRIARKKGRVVLVGVAGKEYDRDAMYEKELDFVISTSYGPGRYDDLYEQGGIDYPYGYVRWTEKRNMRAYLQMIAAKQIDVARLIHSSYPVDQADQAYASLKSAESRPLLVTLNYANAAPRDLPPPRPSASTAFSAPTEGPLVLALIGAGAFIQGMHLPNLKKLSDRFRIRKIMDLSGAVAAQASSGAEGCEGVTDMQAVLNDPEIKLVVIGTRHNTHAELAVRALEAGKGVFVEKPMCLTESELERLKRAVHESEAPFVVGYNRRFAPHVSALRDRARRRKGPLMIHYTMNAGYIAYDHWVHTEEGGGRILGEACHLIDLFRSLVGSPAVSVSVDAVSSKTEYVQSSDNVIATIKYKDGSVCSLLYTAIGHSSASKERMEVFFDETLCVLDDYLTLSTYGCKSFGPIAKKQDKGHLNEWIVLSETIRKGGRFPIPWDELEETWRISSLIADRMREI
jgi:predicted dehydrogenase